MPVFIHAVYGGSQADCFEIEQSVLTALKTHKASGEWLSADPSEVCETVECCAHMSDTRSLGRRAGSVDATFRENLCDLLQSRGMTQVELAGASGVSQRMISKLQRGESSPTITTAEMIAQGFGMSLVSFLEYQS